LAFFATAVAVSGSHTATMECNIGENAPPPSGDSNGNTNNGATSGCVSRKSLEITSLPRRWISSILVERDVAVAETVV
jgi:hypothetical protein